MQSHRAKPHSEMHLHIEQELTGHTKPYVHTAKTKFTVQSMVHGEVSQKFFTIHTIAVIIGCGIKRA